MNVTLQRKMCMHFCLGIIYVNHDHIVLDHNFIFIYINIVVVQTSLRNRVSSFVCVKYEIFR